MKTMYQPAKQEVVDVQFIEMQNKPEPEPPKPKQIEHKAEATEPEQRSPKEVIESIVNTLFSKADSQLYQQLLQLEKSIKKPNNI